MKTFNKRGDQGETSLLYGARVPKTDPHCEAYGTVDEAVSALGLARSLATGRVAELVLRLQRDLFILNSELATPIDSYPRLAAQRPVITSQMVDRLERGIDEFEAEVEMPRDFIIPGDCPSSAALDLARAIIRRAERRVVSLKSQGLVPNQEIPRYLNRLADLVFTLARYEEKEAAKE